jgi:hypothetical protein
LNIAVDGGSKASAGALHPEPAGLSAVGQDIAIGIFLATYIIRQNAAERESRGLNHRSTGPYMSTHLGPTLSTESHTGFRSDELGTNGL